MLHSKEAEGKAASKAHPRMGLLGMCQWHCTVPIPVFAPRRRKLRGFKVAPLTIGEHLRKARVDRGVTLEEAAQMFGVFWHTVQRWEYNRKNPKPATRIKIVQFLGYDPET